MVVNASLEGELAAIAGRDAVSPGSATFTVDGMEPGWVVRPGSAEDVARVLAWADTNRVAAIPLGGKNHAGRGNLPSRYDIAIDLTRLDRVVEFEPADLTITVEAGLTVSALRETTAKGGLNAPFDPSAPENATVGGMIAAAISGPSAVSLGQPRDFVIGMKVVTADGRVTKTGGKVVKNVSGYDLCKLYTGSLGTLGVIVEASMKLTPVSAAQEESGWRFASADKACSLANRAYTTGLNVHAMVVRPDLEDWTLSIRLAGAAAGVERSRHELERLAVGADRIPPPVAGAIGGEAMVLRIGCLPSRLPSLLEALRSRDDAEIEAYPVSGTCRVASTEQSAERIAATEEIARTHGASVVVEQCFASTKQQLDVFGPYIPGLELMRRIKREWDPRGTLSPGRGPGRI